MHVEGDSERKVNTNTEVAHALRFDPSLQLAVSASIPAYNLN